ncbi:hypothetical protein PRZ48_015263 [Zasmidium cellare]|uniref:Uncharacterized protein n=1 Tax=Zasmidium cellare TaxID=395010 RepID=A0ABR0DX38_ZASCE|nr:hypothetical protein PRZ48_015263 [Zasmidium cellare]
MALPPKMDVNTVKIFHPETPFTVFSEDRGAAAWAGMIMNFDIGTAYVADHQRHGLFASELNSSIPGYENYAVAMYHQLHCLATIRQEFYTLNVTAAAAYGQHIGHCFEYLRQSLICNADLTLEYTAVGWEVEHLCKNPKEVQTFMKEYNKANKAYPISH